MKSNSSFNFPNASSNTIKQKNILLMTSVNKLDFILIKLKELNLLQKMKLIEYFKSKFWFSSMTTLVVKKKIGKVNLMLIYSFATKRRTPAVLISYTGKVNFLGN